MTIVKEYEFDKPLIHKIDSINDDCIRDCHNKHFHTFEQKCVYDIKLTNSGDKEIVNITVADRSMSLYDLKEKLKISTKRFYN